MIFNKEFNPEQQAILDKARSEKRSLSQEEVDKMNQIISSRSIEKKDEEKEDEEVKEESTSETIDETENQENKKDEENNSDNSGDSDSDEDDNEKDTEDEEERSVITQNQTINNRNTKTNIINNTMEFSLLKAINNVVNNRAMDVLTSAVNEKGIQEMRKTGLNYAGQIQLPVSELRAVTVAAEGEDVVATDLYDILEPLRAKNILVQAGAKFMTGLVGDIQVPTMSAGNVTWEGETASAKEAEYTFSSVKLSPKRLTAYVDISKQFIAQDSKDAETLIRQDIVKAINAKLESTVLGDLAGTATQPAGIFAGADLDTVADYEDICAMECAIEDENVFGEMKYIMSNKAKAALRCMAKSEHNDYVLSGNTVDGTPYLNTSHISGKKLAYGDFSQLAIGQWGSLDLIVDPYTKAADGQIRIVVNMYVDAKVLRPEAIVCATIG